MLSRQANHALKALLLLAADPLAWRSTHSLAAAQSMPEPMLEQLLLRLRRAGLLIARRGRTGGYRLARSPRAITVLDVLTAVAPADATLSEPAESFESVADQVTAAVQRRLERAHRQAMEQITLEDLSFDLRSAEAGAGSEAGLLLG